MKRSASSGDRGIRDCGASDQFVVNVGEVLNVTDVEPLVLQVATQDIEDDITERVADVAVVVRRYAADIDSHGIARGLEFLERRALSVL